MSDEEMKLGDVPHLFSLVPLAQSANAPIHALRGGDSLVGSQFQQQRVYIDMIEGVVAHLLENVRIAP
jgi:hypothetical protein